jgi:hypothetical protein
MGDGIPGHQGINKDSIRLYDHHELKEMNLQSGDQKV